MTERERRLLADVGVLILEGDRQRFDRTRVTNLAERERDLLADIRVRVFDGDDERVDSRAIAQLPEGDCAKLAELLVTRSPEACADPVRELNEHTVRLQEVQMM